MRDEDRKRLNTFLLQSPRRLTVSNSTPNRLTVSTPTALNRSQVVNTNNLSVARQNTAARPPSQQQQRITQLEQETKQMSPMARFRSVLFDANAPSDRLARLRAGQPEMYRDQQQQLRPGSRPDQNVGQAIFRGPAQFLNTAEAARKQIGETARGQLAMWTGNQDALRASLERQRRQRQAEFQPDTGLLGVGTIFNSPEESMNLGTADIAKRVGASAAETGSFLVGGGALPGIGRAVTKGGARQLAKFAAIEAGAGAVGGGAGTVVRDPNASAKEVAFNATVGAVLAPMLAIPLTAGTNVAARRIASSTAGRKALRSLAQETDETLIGNAIRASDSTMDDATASRLSKQISEAKTPKEVENILANRAVDTPQPRSTTEQPPTRASEPVVDALRGTKDEASVRESLRYLYPDMDEATATNVSKTIARTDDPDVIRQTIEQAQVRTKAIQDSIQAEVPQGEPVRPKSQQEAQAQQLQEAIEQGQMQPARTQEPIEQALAESQPQTQPATRGIADATDAQVVPETRSVDEINRQLTEQAQQTSDRFIPEGRLRELESNLNPTAYAERIDRARGTAGDSLKRADESLAGALDASRYTDQIALRKLDEAGVSQLTGKYTGQAETEFNRYLNIRFAREALEKEGKNIMPGMSKQDMDAYISNYQATNPGAVNDAQTIKKWADRILQDAEDAGLLETGTAKFISSKYDAYAPLERMVPENLETMVSVDGGRGSIGKQRVVQNLIGSDVPLVEDFTRIINKGNLVERQISNTKIAKIIQKAADEGYIANSKTIVTAEQSKALTQARKTATALREELSKAQKQVGRARIGKGKATLEKNLSERKAVNRARDELRKVVNDPDAASAINDMKPRELLEVFNTMATDAPPPKNTRAILKSYASKSAKHQEVIDKIAYTKAQRDGVAGKLSEINSNISDLQPGSTTGKVVISGLDGGFPFKVEINDQALIRMMKNMKPTEMGIVPKVFAALWRPFRMTFTGFLNPNFLLRATLLYDAPMTSIISPVKWRNRLNSEAVKETVRSLSSKSEFSKLLQEQGTQLFNSSRMIADPKISAERIAIDNNIWSKIKHISNPKNIADTIERMDTFTGRLEGVHRARHAKAGFDEARKAGATPEAAAARARYIYQNVGPNYGNTTNFLRQLDAFSPYLNASVAGTRSFLKAARSRPGRTAATSAIMFGAPAVGAVALSMKNNKEAYSDFIADMEDSNKQYILDNNFIIALPGASKDDKTGEWSGIIKIPVPPEMRGVNKAMWRQAYDLINGNGITNPAVYAGALFDSATGQISPIDPVTGEARPNINPAVNLGLGLATNKDLASGRDITSDNMDGLEKSEQAYPWTPGAARKISELTGSVLSPIEVQYVINQFGSAPKAVQTEIEKRMYAKGEIPKEQVSDNSLLKQAIRSYYGGWGKSQSAKKRDEFAENVKGASPHIRKKVEAYRSFNFDKDGNLVDNPFHKYQRAADLLNDEVFSIAKKDAYTQKKIDGRPVDPLFDLPAAERRKVLHSRGMVPGSKDLELSRLRGTDWYDDFKAKESLYYESMAKWRKANGQQERENDNPYPTPDKRVSNIMKEYSNLPKGDGPRGGSPTRSAWIKNNPEKWDSMQQFYAQQTRWTNEERKKIGLAPLPEDEYYAVKERFDPDKKGGSGFARGGTGRGGTGRGGRGSRAGRKESPERMKLGSLLGGVGTGIKKVPEIRTTAQRSRFRVQKPSSSRGRRFKKIRV